MNKTYIFHALPKGSFNLEKMQEINKEEIRKVFKVKIKKYSHAVL